jgi:D-alanine-D-alanine ligase
MLVGLTFDLRSQYLREGYSEEETAEFDRDDTIDALERAIKACGHDVARIGHARNLIEALGRNERWDLVFNIAEGLHGLSREAQVPAILDVYEIPYTFSDPLVMALTLHKQLTKIVVERFGIPTPAHALVANPAQIAKVDLPFPLFAKPVAEGTSKGVTPASKVVDRAGLETVCRDLLARFKQPVLIETFLPGREVTVAIVGTGKAARALGTMEVILLSAAEAEVYSYVNKERCEELVEYRLIRPEADPMVARAEEVALQAWRALECRDAGRVDLRCDAAGLPNFMEVNPLAGLHPEHSDLPIICNHLGFPYQSLIALILDSASQRLPKRGGAPR